MPDRRLAVIDCGSNSFRLVVAEILGTPAPVGTAIAVAPGSAAVGHASEPDDVVVFALGRDDGPRVDYERADTRG